MNITDHKTNGFPVFKGYGLRGPSDEEVDEAIRALAEIDLSLEMISRTLPRMADRDRSARQTAGEIIGRAEAKRDMALAAPALKRVRIAPTSARIVERFCVGDRPSLFLELANVRAGEILTFVGRNGCLSGNADGDPAIEWVREVESLRRALYALDVSQRNPDTELLKLMAPEAAILLRQLLNERLSGVATALDEQLHLTAGTGRLVDAIWMQVAVAAHSRRRIAKCHRCGTFFEPAGVAAQAGRSYCSHACKIAAYRARQRKAAEMREKGASVREIAKSVGSDVETVKGWLSKGDK